jgi:hypothetical protein
MTTAAEQPKAPIATIWCNGVTAAVVAAVINVILYYAGVTFGGFPPDVLTPMGQPITVLPVIGMSVATILLGTLAYTILSRYTANPNRWFLIVTAIIFIVMLPNPLLIANAPVLMIVLLEVMHVVAAGAAIYYLTRS